ncbi:claudin domain-containing protein 2-like isoform X2 [Porites lutea]|uniref:claudin domain-containing protein 2-like isoform X2 n=1 Tax=Porites lutea TaxID=51062 RepID=UPI003CC52050
MIKVITSFVSCLAAILLGVLALATDFWRVSWREAKEISGVQFNHEGLFHTCHETSINNTVVAADSCTDLHGEGRPDWNGVVIAFMVLGLLFHLVAFIFAIIAACRKGHPFPSFWVAGLFFIAAIMIIIALLVYTFHNWKSDVFFSWSYGGGWSTVALSIIAVVLIMADR